MKVKIFSRLMREHILYCLFMIPRMSCMLLTIQQRKNKGKGRNESFEGTIYFK